MSRKFVFGVAMAAAVMLVPQSRAENFTGLYLGANLGYATGEGTFADRDDWSDCLSPAVCPWSFDIDGATGGVQAGYDWALGPWRLGLVGEVSLADVSGAGPYPNAVTTIGDETLDRLILARTRGGYVFGEDGDSFIYATVGGGWVHVEAAINDTVAVMQGNTDEYVGALAYGVGIEHQMTPTLSLGVEWLRLDLSDTQVTGVRASNSYRFDVDAEVDVFRLTVNWAL